MATKTIAQELAEQREWLAGTVMGRGQRKVLASLVGPVRLALDQTVGGKLLDITKRRRLGSLGRQARSFDRTQFVGLGCGVEVEQNVPGRLAEQNRRKEFGPSAALAIEAAGKPPPLPPLLVCAWLNALSVCGGALGERKHCPGERAQAAHQARRVSGADERTLRDEAVELNRRTHCPKRLSMTFSAAVRGLDVRFEP